MISKGCKSIDSAKSCRRGRVMATCVVVIGLTLFAGCQKSNRLPTYPVSGTVAFPDGRPLESGSVLFESVDLPMVARGVIQQGAFQLTTFEEADGAIAGRHRVAILPMPPEGVDPDAGPPPGTIDARFMHMDTSRLEFEVKPDEKNHFAIEVTASGQR